MKQNYSGIWSYHQYNIHKYDKRALSFAVKTNMVVKQKVEQISMQKILERSTQCSVNSPRKQKLSGSKFSVSFEHVVYCLLSGGLFYYYFALLSNTANYQQWYYFQHRWHQDKMQCSSTYLDSLCLKLLQVVDLS